MGDGVGLKLRWGEGGGVGQQSFFHKMHLGTV